MKQKQTLQTKYIYNAMCTPKLEMVVAIMLMAMMV
jgi:hypothetical protein